MTLIKETLFANVTIQLSEDKQITLGPRETTQISADEFESEGVQKSLRDGLIVALPVEAVAKSPKPKTSSK